MVVSFPKFSNKKDKVGKASLRRMQWKLAERNATMGIWLGKQYLDQKDKNEDEDNQEEMKEAKEIIVSIRKAVDDNES